MAMCIFPADGLLGSYYNRPCRTSVTAGGKAGRQPEILFTSSVAPALSLLFLPSLPFTSSLPSPSSPCATEKPWPGSVGCFGMSSHRQQFWWRPRCSSLRRMLLLSACGLTCTKLFVLGFRTSRSHGLVLFRGEKLPKRRVNSPASVATAGGERSVFPHYCFLGSGGGGAPGLA